MSAPETHGGRVAIDWTDRLARRTVGNDGALTGIPALANAGVDVINFSGGFPAPEMFPTADLGSMARDLFDHDAATALQYSPSEGIVSVRDAVGDHVGRIDGLVPVDGELMITSGGIDGVTLLARSMLDPGDLVAVEEPTYLGAVAGFNSWQATMRGLPIDDDGLVVDGLIAMIEAGSIPKIVYVIPEYQNPTGRTMSAERRRALVRVCRQHGILLAEDVAYRELGFSGDRLPSLWSLAPDCVVQLGTFSKTFFPGVRLGWAVGPRQVIAALAVAKQNSDQCAGALGQRLVETYLRDGRFEKQTELQRAFYRERGLAMDGALRQHMPDDVEWNVPTGGFFCWIGVPGIDTEQLAAFAARHQQVAVVPGAPFFAERPEHAFARLSFSRASLTDIDEGIARLASAITSLRSDGLTNEC